MKLNIQKYLEISTIHGLFYTSKRHHSVERFDSISMDLNILGTSLP